MKYRKLFILPLLLIFLSGCSALSALMSERAQTNIDQTRVTDIASLLVALQAEGVTVAGDTVSQPFFDVEGQIITVNDNDIQVFEFMDNSTAQRAATMISPDGSSVGTSTMMWVEPPHFYQAGRLIVLYVGNNEDMLSILSRVVGEQIAGR